MPRAINVTAQTITAECPCGGGIFDERNESYQLTSDSVSLRCDTCGRKASLPKTARIFA